MTERARRLALACLSAAALLPVPGTMAQGLSPQVDRDSPAAIEYQLPLERAREEAAGVPPQSRGADDDVPLFGVGVEPAKQGASRAATDGPTAKAKRATRAGSAVGATPPAIVRAEAPPPGGAGTVLPVLAAAAGVLLLGSLAGLTWRRRSTRR